jgi:hypothetical protein
MTDVPDTPHAHREHDRLRPRVAAPTTATAYGEVMLELHRYYTDGPSSGRRKAIPATCGLHRGPISFANLLVSMRGGTIVLDPHVTGSCVIFLDEDGAGTLRNILTEWLR